MQMFRHLLESKFEGSNHKMMRFPIVKVRSFGVNSFCLGSYLVQPRVGPVYTSHVFSLSLLTAKPSS